jgi:hypothetical protein
MRFLVSDRPQLAIEVGWAWRWPKSLGWVCCLTRKPSWWFVPATKRVDRSWPIKYTGLAY